MAKNVSYAGGFLDMLASLAARALPTLLTGLTTGLLSGGIDKAISGNGLFLQKHGKCYQVQKCKGDGLYLAPHLPLVNGDGLFLTDYPRMEMVHLLPPFVFIMGGYMCWTVLPRWRLAIDILQRIQ